MGVNAGMSKAYQTAFHKVCPDEHSTNHWYVKTPISPRPHSGKSMDH